MLKNSKTTIRELTKRYRTVLIAGVIASSFVATGAGAVEVNLADGSGTADVVTSDTLNSAVSTINNSVNTETQARTEADVELDGKITANQNAIAQNENTIIQLSNDIANLQSSDTDFAVQINDNINDINQNTADIGNLKDADIELQNKIDAEAQARADADTTLQGNINIVNTQVTGVINRVTTNETDIADLKNAVGDAANGLVADVENLKTADTTLQNNIDAVQDNLDTEAQTRETADTTLQNNLNTEAQTRADADTTLQGEIDALSGQVGDITTLKTTQKDTVVGSINEIVDNVTVVDGSYNHVTQGAGVADNLVALDSAIGTTADGNYVQSANTIGQNLNALDTKIGVVSNGAQVSASNTIGQNINALDNAIGNRTIDSENAAINEALKTNVAAAFTATGNAIGDMNFADTRYVGARSDLSSAVRSLDNAVSHLDHRIDTLADETKAGFASTAALAGLVPNARANGNTQLAIGTGAYRGSVGGAVGLYHYFNDNVLVNAGFSYAGDKSAIGKAGVTFGW